MNIFIINKRVGPVVVSRARAHPIFNVCEFSSVCVYVYVYMYGRRYIFYERTNNHIFGPTKPVCRSVSSTMRGRIVATSYIGSCGRRLDDDDEMKVRERLLRTS